MDLKDSLKSIVEAAPFNWRFEHARRDYMNLADITDAINAASDGMPGGETLFWLDPVTRSPHDTGITYSGNFMVLTNSDLDAESYDEKFETYIRPLIDLVLVKLKNKLKCTYDINRFSAIEVINVLDLNGDGLSVQYELKGYN